MYVICISSHPLLSDFLKVTTPAADSASGTSAKRRRIAQSPSPDCGWSEADLAAAIAAADGNIYMDIDVAAAIAATEDDDEDVSMDDNECDTAVVSGLRAMSVSSSDRFCRSRLPSMPLRASRAPKVRMERKVSPTSRRKISRFGGRLSITKAQ